MHNVMNEIFLDCISEKSYQKDLEVINSSILVTKFLSLISVHGSSFDFPDKGYRSFPFPFPFSLSSMSVCDRSLSVKN